MTSVSANDLLSKADISAIPVDFFREVITTACDIALLVSSERTIVSVLVNDTDESLGDFGHWEQQPLPEVLTEESVPKFLKAHEMLLSGGEFRRRLELNHRDRTGWEFPVQYAMRRYDQGSGVLMLGRDLRTVADAQQRLINAQLELEKTYERHRAEDARYRVLLNSSRDAIVLLSATDGCIQEANQAARLMFGAGNRSLVGQPIAQVLKQSDAKGLLEKLLRPGDRQERGTVTLQTPTPAGKVRVYPKVFRTLGEQFIMVRIEAESTPDRPVDPLTANLTSLFYEGRDAIVFCDERGAIENANARFLELIDAGQLGDVKGRSLSDFLRRGRIDLNVLLENSKSDRQVRSYSTDLIGEYGSTLGAEISATCIDRGDEPVFGCIIRDTIGVDALRQTARTAGTEDTNSKVRELVGSLKLREIVAEATDVVEKMCIETAVAITRNNRVAAAEMLGLSRQSLYVKLRKYGLLKKNPDE